MQKTVRTTVYEMKCDVCGKEESIKHEDITMFWEFYTRHWTRLIVENTYAKYKDVDKPSGTMDLCPKCAKKLKKLIMAVEVEDED